MEVPKPYSSKYIKSVAYRGPVLWNQVKPELRCLVSKQGFASALKSHYWELYKAHHHAHYTFLVLNMRAATPSKTVLGTMTIHRVTVLAH